MSGYSETEQDKAQAQGVEHKPGGHDDGATALHSRFAGATPQEHHEMTKRLLRKVDFHLLPLLILM